MELQLLQKQGSCEYDVPHTFGVPPCLKFTYFFFGRLTKETHCCTSDKRLKACCYRSIGVSFALRIHPALCARSGSNRLEAVVSQVWRNPHYDKVARLGQRNVVGLQNKTVINEWKSLNEIWWRHLHRAANRPSIYPRESVIGRMIDFAHGPHWRRQSSQRLSRFLVRCKWG